jgi:hypothetical protein
LARILARVVSEIASSVMLHVAERRVMREHYRSESYCIVWVK